MVASLKQVVSELVGNCKQKFYFEEAHNEVLSYISGLPSPSSSLNSPLGLSLGASHDFRPTLKPPNKKKYDEEVERLIQEIKIRDTELVK